MAQNDKKACLSCSISQEPYIIWLSFMAHICKMIISPGDFFIFSNFWILRLLGWWKGKKWFKTNKKFCIRLHSSGTSNNCHLWDRFKIIYLDVFSFFFKILIFGVVSGVKGQKGKKWSKITKFCVALHMWNHTSYECYFWYTFVKW